MAIHSELSHYFFQFSIVMLVYHRVIMYKCITVAQPNTPFSWPTITFPICLAHFGAISDSCEIRWEPLGAYETLELWDENGTPI